MKIYFIQYGDGGPIKIGLTGNPYSRISTLQCGTPTRLSLVAVIDGTADEERALHDRFNDSRIDGEWFEPTPDLLNYISGLPKPDMRVMRAVKRRSYKRLAPHKAKKHWFNLGISEHEALSRMHGWYHTAAVKAFGPRHGKSLSRQEMARRSHAVRNANTEASRMPIADARAIWQGHPNWSNDDCLMLMHGWTEATAYRKLGPRQLAKGRPRAIKQVKP